ncbi:MAG TPA: PD-(D/E)XK nuclease family protein, partial [Bryobacteraceae bacterium]|nr:PD-(D/E)XK nuclease family protein [Bryobacteraceae bacterium]
MTPGNGHSKLSFLDRAAILFGRPRVEEVLAAAPARAGKNGDVGEETAGCPPPRLSDAKPQADLGLNLEVAEILSPSQVSNFLNCAASWYFKHFMGLPDKTDAKRALGKAVDRALSFNFARKMDTKKDLAREELLEIFGQAWKEEAEQASFAADDDQAELERTGAVLAQKYLTEVASQITPIAVQQDVSGVIAGVKVRGKIDLLDSNGRVIDLKVSSKKPSEIMPDHKRQLATYVQITPGASGKTTTQTLVRTKT